jgi:hypothetical protein
MVKYDIDALIVSGKTSMLREVLVKCPVSMENFSKLPKRSANQFHLLLETKPYIIWYKASLTEITEVKNLILEWISEHFQ